MPADNPDQDAAETSEDAAIIEYHVHPVRSFDTPSGKYRIGAIKFATAADGENVVVGLAGGITYNFKNALTVGDPGVGIVEVKVQGTMDLTVRKLAQAILGVTDAANINYGNGGAGTKPHPNVLGFYTSVRFDVSTTQVGAGSSILFIEKTGDQTDLANPLTLTSTTVGSTVIVFIRTYVSRYLMNGNAAALGNRIAGDYQMVIPMGSVMDDLGNQVYYDPQIYVSEAVKVASQIIECDFFYSTDEITFNLISFGLDVSKDSANLGAQQFMVESSRIPPGGGLYVRMRSDGTNPTDWTDFKIHSHYYPVGV